MNKRNILVLEPFCDEHIKLMKKAAGDEFDIIKLDSGNEGDIKTALKDAEIVIGQPDISLLQNPLVNIPKLKLIQMTWAGTDMYTRNVLPFPSETVSLANASGAYGNIISQYVIAMILSLMLNMNGYYKQQLNMQWNRIAPIKSLDHAKVLIYGAGDIGTQIAKRLQGFSAYTIGVCKHMDKTRPYFNLLCTLDEAEAYIPKADVVVGCIPNTDKTNGYMNSARIRMMKSDAILVNVGRGNFVDCSALDDILRDGHLWGASLDVTSPEPLPKEHPLWSNPKCIITPHTSGVAFGHLARTEELLCEIACKNIKLYIEGKELVNRVSLG